MAFERYNEDDDLQRQLQAQLQPEAARQMQPGGMSTQPMGAPTKLDSGGGVPSSQQTQQSMGGGRWATDDELTSVGLDPANYARKGHAWMPDIDSPNFTTGGSGNPLGGANTGVAGGKDMGSPVALPLASGTSRADAARAAAANNYTDIEGTDPLKTGGYLGNLEGFNTQGWGTGERGSGTHKNKFGQIASRYDPTQAGATKALMADPDFQAYFPDAKLVEHPNGDLIDFGDGKPVDVLRGARAGGAGEAWQWGVDAGGPGAGAGGSQMPRSAADLMGGDPMGGIQSQISQLIDGQNPQEQSLIQQLLAEMQP